MPCKKYYNPLLLDFTVPGCGRAVHIDLRHVPEQTGRVVHLLSPWHVIEVILSILVKPAAHDTSRVVPMAVEYS